MVIKMKFEYGQKIKELREKENVTQKELAEALKLTRSAINQFEQQYNIIPIKRLNQIANFFNNSSILINIIIAPQISILFYKIYKIDLRYLHYPDL